MRAYALMLAFSSAIGLSSAAIAQSGATRSVDDYLCTFAGKCGDQAEPIADESIAAPDTKGMSLAKRAKPTQEIEAPETKAMSLSKRAKPATSQTAPARSATRTTTPRPARSTNRMASSTPVRNAGKAAQGKRMDLRLEFMLDSAELTPQAKAEAEVFAKSLLMPELAGKKFLIEGHTDSTGSRAYNMLLSSRRAAAVADYLSSLGVPRERLQVRGFGPSRPLDGRSASSPENRRVEAVLL